MKKVGWVQVSSRRGQGHKWRGSLLFGAFLGFLLFLPQEAAAQEDRGRQRSLSEDLQLFSQVLNQIRVNHPDSVDLHTLVLAAIQGMVEAADPHSWVIPSMRMDPEKEEALRQGRHIYLPVRFEFMGGSPMVVAVDPGTQASQEDIYPGDVLLKVNGVPVMARNSEELAIQLSGPEDEALELTLERWGLDGSRIVLRRLVPRDRPGGGTAVPGSTLLQDGIGYVRVMTFDHPEVAEHLRNRLEYLKDEGMRGLVLDLRDNPGGVLDQASEVAGLFLPRGEIVYTSEGRREELVDTIRVTRSFFRREERYPVAILVNAGTASAAEVVAAAIQDHDRGVVVGRPTFGKALIVSPFIMSDGSVLMLVVGNVRTPCGRLIQRPYRDVPISRYWALAGLDPDTTQLPSCKSDAGRTLFGGGGIHPDLLLPQAPQPPVWWTRAAEKNLRTRWAGSFVAERSSTLTSVQALLGDAEVGREVVRTFRVRSAEEGLKLDAVGEDVLLSYLLPEVARVRWGLAEAIQVSAALDPAVDLAVGAVLDLLERSGT